MPLEDLLLHIRFKTGVGILAAVGAVSSCQFIAGIARAQQPPPAAGRGFGGGFQGRMGPPNFTAKVTIDEAIKTATDKTAGFVSSAQLRPAGRPAQGEPPKLIWVIHVVTSPTAGPGQPGKGENVAVDAQDNMVVPMPPPPARRAGRGFGGGSGGPPPSPAAGGN
ncbi:MAG: hypothetical protein ACYC96_07185 [Fimbriimonadaceae bacterium]